MKYLLRYLAFVLMVGSVCAQSNLPACSGLILNWSNCFGVQKGVNGYSYAGEFKDGKYNGQGTEIFANGNKYTGEFKDNQRNGQGTWTFADGSPTKEGLFVNGNFVRSAPIQKVGSAFAQTKLPSCYGNYLGVWTDCFGEADYGYGVYVGEWRGGFPHGLGRLNGQYGYWANGNLVKATPASELQIWINESIKSIESTSFSQTSKLPACSASQALKGKNCFAGLKLPNGDVYLGEWRDGRKNGQGTYTYKSNGQKYEGEWIDDKASGLGTFTYSDGIKYVGEWKDGKRQGQGIEYAVNGSIINQGLWIDNQFAGTTISQQVTAPNFEVERNRAEAEEAQRKQVELESQLALAQQKTNQNNTLLRNSKRIALVIGNANYNSAPLKNPLNDAADISAALRQSGFEVIDQRNVTLQEMTRGIREFGDKLLKSDVGLVYYSGHGLEVKGRNYLLPVNASMIREDEIAFQAIDANLILEKMNTAKKSVNILIVDACRDNPFARSFRSTNRGLAQMDAPTGTIVSFSTSPGKTASDGDGRNSPFTKNLVKAMMRADMPIEAMFKEVRKSVVEETKGQQTPWESSSLIGDFYFKVSK